MRKGLWSPEEDEKLKCCIAKYMNGSWSDIARKAGLQRCGKSCRRRWMNHLRPELKRGKFTQAEVRLVIELQQALGNRWSEIAAHLVGRTDNDVKNLWNTQIKKKLRSEHSSSEADTSGSQKNAYEYQKEKACDSSRSDIASFNKNFFPFAEMDATSIARDDNRSSLSDCAPNFPFCIDNDVVESLPQRWRNIKPDGSQNQTVYSSCESKAYHSTFLSAGCTVITDEWPCAGSASCPDIVALAQPKPVESVKPMSDSGFQAIPPPAARTSRTLSEQLASPPHSMQEARNSNPYWAEQRWSANDWLQGTGLTDKGILAEVCGAGTENGSGWRKRATSVGSSSSGVVVVQQQQQEGSSSKASDCTSPAATCMDFVEWASSCSYGSLEAFHEMEMEMETSPALLYEAWPFDALWQSADHL